MGCHTSRGPSAIPGDTAKLAHSGTDYGCSGASLVEQYSCESPCGSHSPKYFLSGPIRKKFAHPCILLLLPKATWLRGPANVKIQPTLPSWRMQQDFGHKIGQVEPCVLEDGCSHLVGGASFPFTKMIIFLPRPVWSGRHYFLFCTKRVCVCVCSLARVTNISESHHEYGWISKIKIFLD